MSNPNLPRPPGAAQPAISPTAAPPAGAGRGGAATAPTGTRARGPLRPIPVAGAARAADDGRTSDKPAFVREQASKSPADTGRARDEKRSSTSADRRMVRSAPPWLVSTVVHLFLLILLALVTVGSGDRPPLLIEAVYAETLGEQLIADLDAGMLDTPLPDLQTADFSKDLLSVDNPLAAPPTLDFEPGGLAATSDIVAPSIGLALSGREKGAKGALLGKYGGTALTEESVKAGLEWLVRQQDQRTGGWSLRGPYSHAGAVENRIAATAMALLALQGAGNTHLLGDHKRAVARGIEALLKFQDPTGNFFPDGEGSFNHRGYSQAQASIVICELYGMTKDPAYRKAAQRALDYAVKAQSPELGGWRYEPRDDSDLSVTGWFVMALQSGLMAGLDVPTPTLDNVRKFLDSVTPDGSHYAYLPGKETSTAMTAEGLLCRQYLGWPADEPRLKKGVEYLLKNPINYRDQNLYYWYYATQVLHHIGGKEWDQWNKVMRDQVPNHQVKTGRERGSWDPGRDGTWGPMGGRLYTTCLSLYLLEVYYRHLPLYAH